MNTLRSFFIQLYQAILLYHGLTPKFKYISIIYMQRPFVSLNGAQEKFDSTMVVVPDN